MQDQQPQQTPVQPQTQPQPSSVVEPPGVEKEPTVLKKFPGAKEKVGGKLAIVIASIVFSSLAIYLFYTNYLHNFYYPLISYIFGLYVIGFLALLGNAFASVIVWIIGNRPDYRPDYRIEGKEKLHLYTDEEIQRDIEEATQKSLEAAVDQLQFKLEDLPKDIIIGKTVPKSPGTIIRIKDDIDEVLNLSQTLQPGATEKFGTIGIEKASMQLAKTLTQEKKKKGRFWRRKEKSSKKEKIDETLN